MKLLCHFNDGSFTVGRPHTVLLHWYWSTTPMHVPHEVEPLKVYQVGAPVNVRNLLMLAVAACERIYGTAPEVDQQTAIDTPEHDQECLRMLYWLQDHGTVTKLICNPSQEQITAATMERLDSFKDENAQVDDVQVDNADEGRSYTNIIIAVIPALLIWAIGASLVLILAFSR